MVNAEVNAKCREILNVCTYSFMCPDAIEATT